VTLSLTLRSSTALHLNSEKSIYFCRDSKNIEKENLDTCYSAAPVCKLKLDLQADVTNT